MTMRKYGRSQSGLYAPYISGLYYGTFAGTSAATIVAAVDTIYTYPFSVRSPLSVSALALRVSTGQAGSSVKGAIYANGAAGTGVGRPFGAPVAVDNTGVATTTNSLNADLAAAAILYPGVLYWGALKFAASATLPTVVTTLTTSRSLEELIGRTMPSGAAGNGALTGLSIAHAYATAFPTYDGSESWTEVTGAVMPLFFLKAG